MNRMLLCLSHKCTLQLLDMLGKDHDIEIKHWQESIEVIPFTCIIHLPSLLGLLHQATINCGYHMDDAAKGSLPDSMCSSVEGSPLPPPISPLSVFPSSSDDTVSMVSDALPDNSYFNTYKIVGDNIDKEIHPTHMRTDYQTKSLHYFQSYAVQDRINLSQYSSDEPPVPDIESIQLDNLLPTSLDKETMLNNFATLFGRIIVKYMPFFSKFGEGLESHIPHQFSNEMSQKSTIVSSHISLNIELL